MSIRKRRLPSGKDVWLFDYKDLAGKRRARQFRSKALATAYETRIRSEVANGTHVADSSSITVAEAAALWLRRAEVEGLETSTRRQYQQHTKCHVVPLLGTVRLSRLTRATVEQFRDQLLETRSRPLTRAILTSLKGIIKEARRRGLIAYDPAADTEVKMSKRDKAVVPIPSKAELKAMLAKSAELWPITKIERTRAGEQKVVAVSWHPLMATALFTGLRSSELRGLAWTDIDFGMGVIRVSQRADFQNVMGAPKSAAGRREVPLSPLVINTLKAWKLACPATPLKLVFPTETGHIHSNSNLRRHYWVPLQRQLGIVDGEGEPHYHFHALRHAAASLFIEQGWSPKKVQTVMGHASIQVTFDTYGHLWKTPEDDQRAMAQIEARVLA